MTNRYSIDLDRVVEVAISVAGIPARDRLPGLVV
jgi:hypothetical protein